MIPVNPVSCLNFLFRLLLIFHLKRLGPQDFPVFGGHAFFFHLLSLLCRFFGFLQEGFILVFISQGFQIPSILVPLPGVYLHRITGWLFPGPGLSGSAHIP